MSSRADDLNAIRLLADGELPPEGERAVRAAIDASPEGRARLEFERALRARVERVMSDDAAPAAVRERIMAALTAGASGDAPRHPRLARAGSIFRGPTRANVFAVAASLAIVAGAVLFGVFGPPLLPHAQTSELDPFRPVKDAVIYTSGEHGRCVGSRGALEDKIEYTSPAEGARALAAHLGVGTVRLFDLSPLGYQFIGAARCGVPPREQPSGHMLYRSDGGAMISVFIQRDAGQFAFEERVVYRPSDFEAPDPGRAEAIWREDGVVYFVVACNPDHLDGAAEMVHKQCPRRGPR
jgi:anti-sigma factor RsiW